jgi:hypothetical protein
VNEPCFVSVVIQYNKVGYMMLFYQILIYITPQKPMKNIVCGHGQRNNEAQNFKNAWPSRNQQMVLEL